MKKTTRRFVNVSGTALTYLLFDGAAATESASLSLHMFHLLQFCLDDMDSVRAVHTYSSADRAWADRAGAWLNGGWRDWGRGMALIQLGTGTAIARGGQRAVAGH